MSGEEAERLSVAVQVAAEREQLLVAARDELLHHRLVRRRVVVGALELGGALAAEELAPVGPPEADVGRWLDEDGKAELLSCGERLLARTGVERARDRNSDRVRRLELVTLALDALEDIPAREREAVALVERPGVPRDRVQVLVVSGEDR